VTHIFLQLQVCSVQSYKNVTAVIPLSAEDCINAMSLLLEGIRDSMYCLASPCKFLYHKILRQGVILKLLVSKYTVFT